MVAPHAGAWIEIKMRRRNAIKQVSRPTRARGLKFYIIRWNILDNSSRPTRARGLKFNDMEKSFDSR